MYLSNNNLIDHLAVKEILHGIANWEHKKSLTFKSFKKMISKNKSVVFFVMTIFSILIIAALFFQYKIISSKSLELIRNLCTLLLVLILCNHILTIMKDFANSYKSFINRLSKNIDEELSFVLWLQQFNIIELQFVLNRLDLERRCLPNVGRSLIGDVNKVGIFPAVIALAAGSMALYSKIYLLV